MKLEKRTFHDKIQIHPMKQIQNTVPQSQHHARACRPPASQIRRPVRRSGAKSRRASKATRRDEASAEVGRARTTKKREGACVEAEQESIPYLTLRARTEHRVVVVLAPPRGCRVPRLPACLPARAGSPRGPGGRKEARRAGGGAVGCVGRGGRWGCRGPSGFYPRRAPLLFITMAGHRQHPRPPASPLLSSRRVASRAPPPPWPPPACLPVCLPLSASHPLFARLLTAPSSLSGTRNGESARLSPSSPFFFSSPTEARAIGKLSSGRLLGGKDQRSWHLAGLRSWRNALLMTIWSEMMGHLSPGWTFPARPRRLCL